MQNNETKLKPTIEPISQAARKAMREKIDNLAKPVGGLGNLEVLAVDLAGIEQRVELQTEKRCCLVFCGDHGVEREGVSATPRRVTSMQAVNMAAGHSSVAALAKANHCEVKVIDVGIDADILDQAVINLKIRKGTNNFLEKPAMTRDEAIRDVQAGYDVAAQAIHEGNQILCVGELGIANTTVSSAMIASLLSLPVADVVGRGSVISDKRLAHKIDVVEKGLAKWQPDPTDGLDVLSKVGGFEIGAKAGAMICAAAHHVPLIMDGFISYAALALAEAMCPGIQRYVIASHATRQAGTKAILKKLGVTPMFNLGMATGEGSGAVVTLALIDDIQSVLKNMTTLEDMGVNFTA